MDDHQLSSPFNKGHCIGRLTPWQWLASAGTDRVRDRPATRHALPGPPEGAKSHEYYDDSVSNDAPAIASLAGKFPSLESSVFEAEHTMNGHSVPKLVVDLEGLVDRVVAVPVGEARYYRLRAGKDCLLWLRSTPTGVLGDGLAEGAEGPRPTLERYDLNRRRHDRIADPADSFEVSGDGTRIVVRDRRSLRVLRTDRSGSDKPGDDNAEEFDIDVSRIGVTVDPTAEWRQMYDEAGRLMRDHFWIGDMSGVDWAGELARYRPLVDAVGSHDDLVDLLWEVQGELGTSHAYVTPSGGYGSGDRPGLLGADLERDEAGRWRIARVLPAESSDPRARSPLTAPGVDVRAGDVLLAVGGRPVDPVTGPAPLLVGTANQPTELTVLAAGASDSGASNNGAARRVVVLPLADDEQLRYQDWVAGRRAFVADRSEGRLGYLHLPDMVATGWAQLHRDLGRETAREGRFGYASRHLVIALDAARESQPAYQPLRGRVASVQIRTVLQHAWAEFEHDIRYKGSIPAAYT